MQRKTEVTKSKSLRRNFLSILIFKTIRKPKTMKLNATEKNAEQKSAIQTHF